MEPLHDRWGRTISITAEGELTLYRVSGEECVLSLTFPSSTPLTTALDVINAHAPLLGED
jgi:hypothetical protein